MKSTRNIAIVVFVLLLIVLTVGQLLRRGAPPVPAPEGACDASLWSHVYHPQRLRVLEACKVVEGTIQSIRKEADGDYHIRLDVEDKSLLNERNLSAQHGDLVVEPICMNAITQADAAAACAGFTQDVAIPRVGDRVRITGAYVLDGEHGWNEIHPVTRIELLR